MRYFLSRLLPGILTALVVTAVLPVAAASAAPACADLQVADFSVTPQPPPAAPGGAPIIAGQLASVNITVQNVGSCATQGFVVQWRPTPYASSGPSESIVSLGAGDSTVINLDYTFPTAGNFESTVQLDTHNDVNETNEANNLQIFSVTVVKPGVDLSAGNFSIAPKVSLGGLTNDHPVAGRVATATFTVTNTGNQDAGPFQVSWKPGPAFAAITQQVDSLDAYSSTPVSFDYTYPRAGTFSSTVTADSAKTVAESNETNNVLTTSIVVDPAKADLTVKFTGTDLASPIAGTVTKATFEVDNIGNTDAGAFRVSWKPTPSAAALSTQINALAAGASASVSFTYTFPAAGSFTGTATVDSTSAVSEISETNNTASVPVTVAPATVDLTIDNVTVNPNDPRLDALYAEGHVTQGQLAVVNIYVSNNGSSKSGPFLVDWNPDANYVSSPSLSTVTHQVNGLGAGQQTIVTFTYAYPKAGNFSTLSTVDPRNVVKETNETNNQFVLPVTVEQAPIDLVISDFTVNPSNPVRGTPVTTTVTVDNNGPFPTGKFAVQWFPTGTGLPKTMTSLGLQPYASQTFTFTGSYALKGSFTSKAVVDPYNQVPEPNGGEDNNTATTPVTVAPPQTTVRVNLTNLHAFSDGDSGLAGDGEWDPIVLAVLDPTASCTIPIPIVADPTVKGVRCSIKDNQDVDDGDDFNPGNTLDVTLTDSTPLIALVGILENDDPLPPQFLGYTNPIIAFPNTYGAINKTVDGQKGDCDSAPKCFNATITTSVVSSNHAALAASTPVTPAQQQTIAAFEAAITQAAQE